MSAVVALVRQHFSDHYGAVDGFDYPVTHDQAQQLWRHFLDYGLAAFGDYQDAMAEGEPYLSREVDLNWPSGSLRQEREIKLRRGLVVRGRLVEEPSGRPVAGARVEYLQVHRDNPLWIGYGAEKPDFWLGRQPAEGPASGPNREIHVAFVARDAAAVRAFFDAAVAAGAEVLHEPRFWPEYHDGYYGAFVRDPDGNNVEAVCHTAQPGDDLP